MRFYSQCTADCAISTENDIKQVVVTPDISYLLPSNQISYC